MGLQARSVLALHIPGDVWADQLAKHIRHYSKPQARFRFRPMISGPTNAVIASDAPWHRAKSALQTL